MLLFTSPPTLLLPPHPSSTPSPRAVSQNKELKLNLAELQDAYVRLSQQNMELASEVETERHHVGELQRLMKERTSVKEEEEEEERMGMKEEEERMSVKEEEEERTAPPPTAGDDDRIGNEHFQVGWIT